MIGMIALAAAAIDQPVPQDGFDLPVTSLSVPNQAFTCSENGYPTMGIDYENGRGILDYNEVGTPFIFMTVNAVKSVKIVESGEWHRVIIDAEGQAMQGRKKLGYNAKIHFVISQFRDNYWEADWTVEAGKYRRTASGCRPIPSRPRMIEFAQ
jgi:hypothetical protein